MNSTLVFGIDPDMDTPAFAAVLIDADLNISPKLVGVLNSKEPWAKTLNATPRVGLASQVRIFIEKPEIEYARHKGIRKQDIVDLACRAGELRITFDLWAVELANAAVVGSDYISPAEWKGQTPKKVSHGRICRRWGWGFVDRKDYVVPTQDVVLGTSLLKPSDWKHVLDAVGIATWGADSIVKVDRMRLARERAGVS